MVCPVKKNLFGILDNFTGNKDSQNPNRNILKKSLLSAASGFLIYLFMEKTKALERFGNNKYPHPAPTDKKPFNEVELFRVEFKF